MRFGKERKKERKFYKRVYALIPHWLEDAKEYAWLEHIFRYTGDGWVDYMLSSITDPYFETYFNLEEHHRKISGKIVDL